MKQPAKKKGVVFYEETSWFHRVKLLQPDGSVKYSKRGGFQSEAEAEASYYKYEEEFKKASRTYQMSAKPNADVDLKDYLLYWFEDIFSQRIENTTRMVCAYVLYDLILPNMQQDIKLRYANEEYFDSLLAVVSKACDSAGNKSREFLNMAMKEAVIQEYIKRNPISATKSYPGKKPTIIILNKANVKKLLYINRTLKVERQLGRIHNAVKEDFAPKTFTKQEVGLKTESSYREIPIPDYVFEAILKERQVYKRNRNRRKGEFQDMDYICCSNYGRARSKGFHCRYYKQLLAENGLPDIRWHDLRSTYCTLLLKEAFNPKAVSKLMGHAKELITMDVYADNRGIIADGVPEIEEYMKEVLPNLREIESFKKELLEIVVDVKEFLPDAG